MTIIEQISQSQQWCDEQRRMGRRIAFVPTMGFLHEGHLRMIDEAKRQCDVVVCSIFVNPTQFAANEDLSRYPRDMERDVRLLTERGCDMLFSPSVDEMYGSTFRTYVKVSMLSAVFEGAYRPTHFDGVCLVVTKLLNAVPCHLLLLGQKDFQQTVVLRQLIRDLNMNLRVLILPTVRESDGLAMSSRNVYLNPDERAKATVLFRALQNVHRAIAQDIRKKSVLDSIALKTLLEPTTVRLSVDYASCVMANSLADKEEFDAGDEIVCLLAVRVGSTRLIDNMVTLIPRRNAATLDSEDSPDSISVS